MIGHQTIGMDTMLVFFYPFLEKKKKYSSIMPIKEYIMPTIAS
jgi:hypothetical protein